MDAWTLVREFGLPIAMPIIALWGLKSQIWVPGWYAAELREENRLLRAERDEWKRLAWASTHAAETTAALAEKAARTAP